MSESPAKSSAKSGSRPSDGDPRQHLMRRFLRQAPFLPGASDLGVATCPVNPWPHQLEVVRQATDRFPESFLFADEVGLGKTIEAGLALRQLVISGRVRRALLLVPKGIVRQWQQELHEKLVLDVPRYEGGRFVDVHEREITPPPGDANPWNAFPLLLASTQLAKQQARRDEILAATPWDLVLVDEAHHARRRAAGQGAPNELLQLLAGHRGRPGLKDRCRCLYLLSATPMQVHAVELWDLLKLLGLGGRWGASEADFLRFFEELRRPFAHRDWPFLLAMAAEAVAHRDGEVDTAFETWAHRRLATAEKVLDLLRRVPELATRAAPSGEHLLAQLDLSDLSSAEQQLFDSALRRHTPLRAKSFRHTRGLLRAYQRAGRIESSVPRRKSHNIWIPLRDDEGDLYRRIETFVSEFFERYEARRKGLGFAMTLYRRRLTSSFYAVRRSLRRRLESLQGGVGGDILGEVSDGEAPSDAMVSSATASAATAFAATASDAWGRGMAETAVLPLFAEFDDLSAEDEIGFIEDFLVKLAALPHDSKLDQLLHDLSDLLPRWERCIVFTQYLDTMDYLRSQLVPIYGAGVACYSGRGGETWEGSGDWRKCSKEQLKEDFWAGEVQILLCTEAAGEGLNLQTCGLLINYDMPWNPMRVEQRIGRIDRIGQVHPEVWIRNYFYEETVEAEIYRRLNDRIGWFEDVVGTLQPILHGVGESIRRVAMQRPATRRQRLDDEIRQLQQRWDERLQGEDLDPVLDLDAHDPDAQISTTMSAPVQSPVELADLEAFCVDSAKSQGLLQPASDATGVPSPGIYTLTLGPVSSLSAVHRAVHREGALRVTFDARLFDRAPYSVSLLTYGNPLFEALLADASYHAERDQPMGIGLYRCQEPAPVSLFLAPGPQGVRPLETLDALREALGQGLRPWSADQEAAASSLFSQRRRQVLRQQHRIEQGRRRDRRSTLIETARQLLLQASRVEQAQAKRPDLFSVAIEPASGVEAVRALARHGAPWASLLGWVEGDVPRLQDDDPGLASLGRRSMTNLAQQWEQLTGQAADLMAETEAVVQRIEAVEKSRLEPSAGGLLERLWFGGQDREVSRAQRHEPTFLESDAVRPFVNAVPAFDDLSHLVASLRDQEGKPLSFAEERPHDFRWLALQGRYSARRGLCAVPIELASMSRRIPLGAWCLLRVAPPGPWEGKTLLLDHPAIDDPELGSSFTVRQYSSRAQVVEGEEWQPQVVLDGLPQHGDVQHGDMRQTLDDVEDGTLWVIAEVLEVLSSR